MYILKDIILISFIFSLSQIWMISRWPVLWFLIILRKKFWDSERLMKLCCKKLRWDRDAAYP